MSTSNSDRLALTAAAALASGMSYGKYVAQFGLCPSAAPRTPEQDEFDDLKAVCPECGTHFYKTNGNQKYCCPECRSRHTSREAKRRWRARAAAARDADGGGDD